MKKTPWGKLALVFLLSFALFYPSLKYFFTHDDFFLLKISNIRTFGQYLNIFNIFSAPEGLGMYRPLSMQTYYMLGIKVFNYNPMWLHVISFLTFFLLIYLIYRFVVKITNNQEIALVSSLLYATSATHFSHIYFKGAYQELLMAVFVLASLIYYVNYLKSNRLKNYLWVLVFFMLGLASKENAIILPLMFVVTLLYSFRKKVVNKKKLKKHLVYLLPMFLVVAMYMYLRLNYFGLPEGDSYVWEFSFRVINSGFWYLLWSFNIPEMFVDFMGPGLRLNPNLLNYWGKETVIITSLFVAFGIGLFILLIKSFQNIYKKYQLIVYFALWFAIFSLPFIFLPLHKFTYYLTLPLVGIVVLISLILNLGSKRNIVKYGLVILWIALSFTTLKLTRSTHWITRGSETARKIHEYFITEDNAKTKVVFYDTKDDKNLPWSPTGVIKDILSDDDYFIVFQPKIKEVEYIPMKEKEDENTLYLESRQFLDY
ncbi:ArnT family glycosyltransferase [Patescibacteria group bacterium]